MSLFPSWSEMSEFLAEYWFFSTLVVIILIMAYLGLFSKVEAIEA